MHTRRHWLAAMAGCAATFPLPTGALAQPPDPDALAADLPLLKRAYQLLHPGLYRYQTPAQFEARIDALAASLKPSTPLEARYLALAKLTAAIRCGHTYPNFFNQSKAVAAQLFEPANKLPFFFVWVGDRMVVTHNPAGIDGLVRGSEILAIDGVRVATIQATLLPYIRADGSNDAKRRKLLDVQGQDGIETFDVFFPLLFPPRASRLVLTVRDPGRAGERRLAVEPWDRAARRRESPQRADPASPDYWTLAFPEPRVAVITMPGWALYRATWDWRARLDAMFDTIAERGATGLVIDIRDNEGGLDCGHEIVARLIDEELPATTDVDRLVRFRSTPEDLRPFLDTWDRSFDRLGEGATELGNGFYRLAEDDDSGLRRIAPKGPRFRGRVAVLSSAQNSSATFGFIDLIQRHRLARVYGETTGGNQRGINGGSFFFLRLPDSGLEADLPLVGRFPKEPKPDAGLAPDVPLAPSVEDIAAGRDRVMLRAVADLVG